LEGASVRQKHFLVGGRIENPAYWSTLERRERITRQYVDDHSFAESASIAQQQCTICSASRVIRIVRGEQHAVASVGEAAEGQYFAFRQRDPDATPRSKACG
jgi:hypothetical protein